MWYGSLTERGGSLSGQEWPFEWGVIAPPGNVQRMTLLSMRAYVMSSRAENPKAAWEWLAFVANRPPASLSVPPIKTTLESAEFRGAYRADVAEAARQRCRSGIPAAHAPGWIRSAGWIWQADARVFAGGEMSGRPTPLRRCSEQAAPYTSSKQVRAADPSRPGAEKGRTCVRAGGPSGYCSDHPPRIGPEGDYRPICAASQPCCTMNSVTYGMS